MSPEGSSGLETDQWVEGMGSKSGMLHCNFGFVGGDYYSLLCFYQNDSLLYLDPSYPDCFVISSVITEPAHEITVSINPNPVRDVSIVSIVNKRDKSMKLEVYTFTGEKIIMLEASDGMKIYRNDFASGIYLFKFTYDSVKITTIKILII